MEFKADLEGFKELIEALDSKTISMVLNKTANDEGSRFRTQVAKDVRAEYEVKSADIKSHASIRRAKGSKHTFEMSISSPRLSLSKFISSITAREIYINRGGRRYKSKRQFVRVKVRRGKEKVIHGGFYAEKQLFKREGKSRLPIKKLTTLSITGMFTEEIIDRGFKKVEDNYPKTLERHLNFYISK